MASALKGILVCRFQPRLFRVISGASLSASIEQAGKTGLFVRGIKVTSLVSPPRDSTPMKSLLPAAISPVLAV